MGPACPDPKKGGHEADGRVAGRDHDDDSRRKRRCGMGGRRAEGGRLAAAVAVIGGGTVAIVKQRREPEPTPTPTTPTPTPTPKRGGAPAPPTETATPSPLSAPRRRLRAKHPPARAQASRKPLHPRRPPPPHRSKPRALLLQEAHRALSAGESARALHLLDEHAARFPSSALEPERSAERVRLRERARESTSDALLLQIAPRVGHQPWRPTACR